MEETLTETEESAVQRGDLGFVNYINPA